MNVDPNDHLPLPDDLSLRDLADAIENRYCARPINHDHRSYERQAIAEGRAGEHPLEHLGDNQLPF